MRRATITPQEPVDTPSGPISAVTLRGVTFAEYCEKGSPFRYLDLTDGGQFEEINHAKLLEMAVAQVVDTPGGQHALRHCSDPRDFQQIIDVMRNFFHPASKSSAPIAASPSTPAEPTLTSIV